MEVISEIRWEVGLAPAEAKGHQPSQKTLCVNALQTCGKDHILLGKEASLVGGMRY